MKQHRHPKPPTPASWQPGTSGNPRGRPRRGHALAERVREDADPAELVAIAMNLARNGESESTVLAALAWLRDSGYRKPAEVHEIAMGNAERDESDQELAALSVEQLRALRELETQREAIFAATQLALPDGDA